MPGTFSCDPFFWDGDIRVTYLSGNNVTRGYVYDYTISIINMFGKNIPSITEIKSVITKEHFTSNPIII